MSQGRLGCRGPALHARAPGTPHGPVLARVLGGLVYGRRASRARVGLAVHAIPVHNARLRTDGRLAHQAHAVAAVVLALARLQRE